MTKYLIKRLLRGAFSIIIVVAIVMTLVYSLMDRKLVLFGDDTYKRAAANAKVLYEYKTLEKYGYLDYVTYNEWLNELISKGELDQETKQEAILPKKNTPDTETITKYVNMFRQYYESKGYTVMRLEAKMQTKTKTVKGGEQQMFAYKDKSVLSRVWTYFTGLIHVDNIHYVKEDIGERKIKFTLYDPVYGGDKFSPAIIGNGTQYKYLLYFDDRFPYLHQNLVKLNLGMSYSVKRGKDISITMTSAQGKQLFKEMTYPTGHTEMTTDDLHMVTYNSLNSDSETTTIDETIIARYGDDPYTNVTSYYKSGLSMVGYSFIIGIIASAIAYMLGLPLGVLMAKHKDKLVDKIGTLYIVFIIAVPSLAYIFMFRAIGHNLFKLPDTFNMEDTGNIPMYILPIISLALPSIASLMRWLRRFMIDQMNSDYVKFARSGGLSEGEIFAKHIFKNAAIPIVHGIPGTILGAVVGAIITERVYTVPGAGRLLTDAIGKYDNAVIVGIVLFYASISVVSIILGDILMAMVDPRINFTTKAR